MARGDKLVGREALARVRGFVFDVDGTLAIADPYGKGHRALPGAPELLGQLRREGLPFVLFTNGSGYTPREIAASLYAAGLDVREEEVITPSTVAAELFKRRGLRKILVLGTRNVSRPLVEAGLDVVHTPAYAEGADAVYVGWYPQFSIADLERACDAVRGGARLYTASKASYFATGHGRTLGISGAICAAIRSVTKCRVVLVGKPAMHGLRSASRRLGLPLVALAVVGDDPALEIAMARAAGSLAIGVRTGLANAASFAALPTAAQPQLVIDSVGDLLCDPPRLAMTRERWKADV